MNFHDLPDFLLPSDEEDPKAVRRYRLRVSLVSCASFITVTAVILPALFLGFFGKGQVAWANETDAKIQRAIEPINRKIDEIGGKVDQTSRENKEIKAIFIGQSIINAKRNQCEAISKGRGAVAWTERIQELKRQYKQLTTEDFEVPSCAEV